MVERLTEHDELTGGALVARLQADMCWRAGSAALDENDTDRAQAYALLAIGARLDALDHTLRLAADR